MWRHSAIFKRSKNVAFELSEEQCVWLSMITLWDVRGYFSQFAGRHSFEMYFMTDYNCYRALSARFTDDSEIIKMIYERIRRGKCPKDEFALSLLSDLIIEK